MVLFSLIPRFLGAGGLQISRHLSSKTPSASPPVNDERKDLDRQYRNLQNRLAKMKRVHCYPIAKETDALKLYLKERREEVGISAGLGSTSRPAFKTLYRGFVADWKELSEKQRNLYEMMATRNEKSNEDSLANWYRAHGESEVVRKLENLNKELENLRARRWRMTPKK